MYDEGKEPRVRFETEVTLTEILAAGSGLDQSSNHAVELAVILKLMGKNDDPRLDQLTAEKIIRWALMASLPTDDELCNRYGVPDRERYESLLKSYGVKSWGLASAAVEEMQDVNVDVVA